MAAKRSHIPPEAEFEAVLRESLSRAFSHLPPDSLEHQTRFKITLGHNEHEVDGARAWAAEGRADILIRYQGRALAVLELKRSDKALRNKDREQGVSYAHQMTPRPPIVVVTNGSETQFYDSATGELLTAACDDESTVLRLFENASKVAAANLEHAVEVLMGPDAGVWASAVRARTSELIEGMSGDAGDVSRPFARELLLPRRATVKVVEALEGGAGLALVTGVPQIGKTNILRELAYRTAESPDYAVLLIRANTGVGLFQRIANLFSDALEWPASANDIRQWLRRMAKSDKSPVLVLAIDGLVANSAVARDLEELFETGIGPRVRVVATTDDADGLLVGANGRDGTALAAIVEEVEVEALDEAEWECAQGAFYERRVAFTRGASVALEYRIPWVLRSLLANVRLSPNHMDEALNASIPATLGLDLVGKARQRLAQYKTAQRGYRLLARDTLKDRAGADARLALERSYSFVVRHDALSAGAREVLNELRSHGWVTVSRNSAGTDLVRPSSPELFLSEYAHALAEELSARCAVEPREAGRWLADRMNGVFLGDLIGAQAILDYAQSKKGYPSELFMGLLDSRPQPPRPLSVGGTYAIQAPDGSHHEFQVAEDGHAFFTDAAGHMYGEPIDLSDSRTYEQLAGWMILSQLASIRTVVDSDGQSRVDLTILLEVGACPVPLMRVLRIPTAHATHRLPGGDEILCDENGVVEPITAAMVRTFATDWQGLDDWFDEALARNSLPLLHRIHLALGEVCKLVGNERALWARDLRDERIGPAMERRFPDVH